MLENIFRNYLVVKLNSTPLWNLILQTLLFFEQNSNITTTVRKYRSCNGCLYISFYIHSKTSLIFIHFIPPTLYILRQTKMVCLGAMISICYRSLQHDSIYLINRPHLLCCHYHFLVFPTSTSLLTVNPQIFVK